MVRKKTMDTYQQELLGAIVRASTEPEIDHIIDTAIENLIQNNVNPHLILRFTVKMLKSMNNMDPSVFGKPAIKHLTYAVKKLNEVKDDIYTDTNE